MSRNRKPPGWSCCCVITVRHAKPSDGTTGRPAASVKAGRMSQLLGKDRSTGFGLMLSRRIATAAPLGAKLEFCVTVIRRGPGDGEVGADGPHPPTASIANARRTGVVLIEIPSLSVF